MGDAAAAESTPPTEAVAAPVPRGGANDEVSRHIDLHKSRHEGAAITERRGGAPAPIGFDYAGPGPTMQGIATACFESGLLYRIVHDGVWGFYNDTPDFEMHVSCAFGRESDVIPLGHTVSDRAPEDSWFRFRLIVYPGETKTMCRGTHRGFRSRVAAKPLSAAYRERINEETNRAVAKQFDAVVQLAHGRVAVDKVLELCVRQGVAYVDIQFPPSESSLVDRKHDGGDFIAKAAWLRPDDLARPSWAGEPELFKEDVSPTDIGQGQLGDCWFLGALAALADHPALIHNLFMPKAKPEQFRRERAVGAFRVLLSKNGWWTSVTLDDYLPCIGSVPCFARNKQDPTELWVSVIEKAYAKLHGAYSAIAGGDVLHAMGDLTGALTFRFDEAWCREELSAAQGNQDFAPSIAVTATASGTFDEDANGRGDITRNIGLFRDIAAYLDDGFLVLLNTPASNSLRALKLHDQRGSIGLERRYADSGLGMAQAYAVLSARSFPEAGVYLLKIRNPWSEGAEWTGAWSDDSELWSEHPEIAAACDVQSSSSNDATFWMQWADVQAFFDGGGVCFCQPQSSSLGLDYRIRGAFEQGFPTLALRVDVHRDVTVTLSVSQADQRLIEHGITKIAAGGGPQKHGAEMAAADGIGIPAEMEAGYVALMLAVCAPTTDGRLKVDATSSVDPSRPSREYSFVHARDCGLRYTFRKRDTPYFVVPRVYDSGITRDFVLGVQTPQSVGSDTFEISFVRIAPECNVHKNYGTFRLPSENIESATTDFQCLQAGYAPVDGSGYELPPVSSPR